MKISATRGEVDQASVGWEQGNKQIVPETRATTAANKVLKKSRTLSTASFAAIAVALLSAIPETAGLPYSVARLLGLGALFCLIATTPLTALRILLILAIAAPDITSSSPQSASVASPWQASIMGIRGGWLPIPILFFHWVNNPTSRLPHPLRNTIAFLAIVPFLTGLLYGGMMSEHASLEVPPDIRTLVFLTLGTTLALEMIRQDARRAQLLYDTLLGACIGRIAADAVIWAAGGGATWAMEVSRVSVDSTKSTSVLVILASLTYLRASTTAWFSWGVGAIALALTAAYGTRFLWLTLALGLFILARSRLIRWRTLLGGIAIGSALLTVGSSFLPETAQLVQGRFSTIVQGRDEKRFSVRVDDNFFSRIDPARYGEILNVTKSLKDSDALLWGFGYGGFYTERSVEFPPSMVSAFSDYSFDSGKFYRAHNTLLYWLLKYGAIGAAILIWLFAQPALRLWRNRTLPGLIPQSAILSLLAFSPTLLFQMTWSSKGMLASSIVLGLAYGLAERSRAP